MRLALVRSVEERQLKSRIPILTSKFAKDDMEETELLPGLYSPATLSPIQEV